VIYLGPLFFQKSMFIIILLVLLFMFLHWFFTVKEGACVLIFANIGAGKTTLLSRYAKRELDKIKKCKSDYLGVVANTPISGCYYVSDIRAFIKETRPEKTLLLIDEAGIVWNNRKMKITDEEIEYVKLIRHRRSKLVAISQSYDDVDIVIRRLYTSMFLLNKVIGITLIRPIKKFVTIDKETQQMVDGYKFRFLFSWGYIYRRLYYKLFDSYWLPEGRESKSYADYQIIPYQKKLNKMTSKIVSILNGLYMRSNKPLQYWRRLDFPS